MKNGLKVVPVLIAAVLMVHSGCAGTSVHRKTVAAEMPSMAPVVAEAPMALSLAPMETSLEVGEPPFNTEAYDRIDENPFLDAARNPLSTFSIDVDTASYTNMRRFIRQGQLPPKDAVRIEEFVNYFRYDYAPPSNGDPFAVHTAVAECPWQPEHRLVRIALKGRELPPAERPASNLVFLIDVSGSMNAPQKLPLLKSGMRLLTEQLDERDRVAMVVYAGAAGLALPSTACDEAGKKKIVDALSELEAGGSTQGSAGIIQAYEVAQKNFIEDGVNRVLLCTDGDFNVGITNQGDLTRLIEEKAKTGVFLTVLGFGMGNIKDSTLEKLADRGNGHYVYIDSLDEARRTLVDEMGGTLVTIAKDVKIQVEFNPARVRAYRLLGYENRLLRDEDFNDDAKDAGEIGAGHTVTAFYEVVPADAPADTGSVDPLTFQNAPELTSEAEGDDLLLVKLRYKQPDGDTSTLMTHRVKDAPVALADADADFRFAAAVAGYGMLLRDSPHKGDATYDQMMELARSAAGDDESGYRNEFLMLARDARALAGTP